MKSVTSSRFAFAQTAVIIPVSRKKNARYAETALAFNKCPKLRAAYHASTPVLGQTKVYSFSGQTYVLACIHENYNDKPLAGHIISCLNDLAAKLEGSKKTLTFAMYPLGCRTPERISFLESMAAINASALAALCETSSTIHLNVVVSQKIEVAYNAWLLTQPNGGVTAQPKQNAFANATQMGSEERGLVLLNDTSTEFQVEEEAGFQIEEILEPTLPKGCTDTGLINEVEDQNRRLYTRLEQAKMKGARLNPTGATNLSFTEEEKAELSAIIRQSTSELQHDILFHEFINRKLEAMQQPSVICL